MNATGTHRSRSRSNRKNETRCRRLSAHCETCRVNAGLRRHNSCRFAGWPDVRLPLLLGITGTTASVLTETIEQRGGSACEPAVTVRGDPDDDGRSSLRAPRGSDTPRILPAERRRLTEPGEARSAAVGCSGRDDCRSVPGTGHHERGRRAARGGGAARKQREAGIDVTSLCVAGACRGRSRGCGVLRRRTHGQVGRPPP